LTLSAGPFRYCPLRAFIARFASAALLISTNQNLVTGRCLGLFTMLARSTGPKSPIPYE
jgi:hypothetical protein